MVDAEEIFQIVREIRLALPDDVQQAKWIRDERDRILGEAKAEHERIIREAKKQADYLVETDDINSKSYQAGARRDKAGRRDSRQSDEDENLRLCG